MILKKVLIIYPNWLPSNAVGVQRVRLIVNFLKEFNWEPIIIAVNPSFYEEEKSDDLKQLVSNDIRVLFVDAKKANKLRFYGDISLRAFGNLKRKAIDIIKKEKIDCMWVPIPPFYTALIARKVYDSTKVPYVIDYIDPWVHDFPGSHRLFSRAKLASVIAKFLEPIAVKKASGFTGVSEAYFKPVLHRNKGLRNIPYCGMPYGFQANDYFVKPNNAKLLWDNDSEIFPYIYAGAFLPNAHFFVDELFKEIANLKKREIFDNKIRFYFVGTGNTGLKSIRDYAIDYGIEDIITEIKERVSYLEILNNLSNAHGILAIGSTEAHYTASKIFQALLSNKPVFPIFHYKSTVIQILQEANADNYLVEYDECMEVGIFESNLSVKLEAFLNLSLNWAPNLKNLDRYSAKYSAKALAEVLNQAINK